jgi:hypothetical protein
MNDLLRELSDSGPNARLVVMPISRVQVERELQIGCFRVYPSGVLDLLQLRPIPNYSPLHAMPGAAVSCVRGQQLREAATSLTGFDLDVLKSSALVAFIADVEWDTFLDATHEDDIELLLRLSALAERAMDIVRFDLCRLDFPATLPGIVGSWEGSSPYLGALLYCQEDHESYLIAGEAGGYGAITSGIGLDLDQDRPEPLPSVSDGEVGAVVVHALSLLSDAMYSRNDTSKFLRAMTLMEYLANPDEFQRWSNVKGNIACHCAQTKPGYLQIMVRLHELSGLQDSSGAERGIRTLVIHHGKFLEEVIPDRLQRRALFAEMFGYIGAVVKDMLEHAELTWDQFTDYRRGLKVTLGVVEAR